MKFLVDAHLPRRLCAMLAMHGHDAMHTLDLPAKNATKDRVVNQISLDDRRVVNLKGHRLFLFAFATTPSLEAGFGQDGEHLHG
jgi:hypothetical protein